MFIFILMARNLTPNYHDLGRVIKGIKRKRPPVAAETKTASRGTILAMRIVCRTLLEKG